MCANPSTRVEVIVLAKEPTADAEPTAEVVSWCPSATSISTGSKNEDALGGDGCVMALSIH